MTKKLIYVCSPYSGDVERNIELAKKYCKFVTKCGHIPFAPHLLFTQFLDDNNVSERQLAFDLNIEMIRRCNSIWVFGDTFSKGMEFEIETAREIGKRVEFKTGLLREGRS